MSSSNLRPHSATLSKKKKTTQGTAAHTGIAALKGLVSKLEASQGYIARLYLKQNKTKIVSFSVLQCPSI